MVCFAGCYSQIPPRTTLLTEIHQPKAVDELVVSGFGLGIENPLLGNEACSRIAEFYSVVVNGD